MSTRGCRNPAQREIQTPHPLTTGLLVSPRPRHRRAAAIAVGWAPVYSTRVNSGHPFKIAPQVWLQGDEPPRLAGIHGLVLRQLPSRAFGDGTHPTTRLCAGAVDLLCRTRRPTAFLDVGTGTGVLARIARARGVTEVVGTDIDPPALDAARANAALDGAPTDLALVDEPPDAWGPRFELVVANILEPILVDLAPSLARALAPGGDLLISGFTPVQAPRLRARFEATMLLRCGASYALEGWTMMAFRREQT